MRFEQAGGFDHRGQRFLQAIDPRHGAADVIEYVAEPDPRAGIDRGQLGGGQPLAHLFHRADDPLKPAQLAAQAKDAADCGLLREHVDCVLFHRLGRHFQLLHDRLIAIDHEIEDRVGDIVRPFGQPLRIAFQPLAQRIVRAG